MSAQPSPRSTPSKKATMNNIPTTADNAMQKTNDAVNKVADTARNVTEGALDGAQHAVKATREAAESTMSKAEESVKEWREGVDPVISDLAAKAQALAEKSINYCAHTGTRLREQMEDYTDATTRYVRDQPGKSVLIAAAAGAAFALVTMALSRRRD